MEWIGRSPVRVSSMFTESMPTSGGTGLHQPLGRPDRHERVALVAVVVRAPVLVPAGVEQHGLPGDVVPVEEVHARFLPSGRIDQQARNVGHATEVEPGEVVPVRVAVERRVEVRPGVRHHLDAPDLELVPGCVAGRGSPPG